VCNRPGRGESTNTGKPVWSQYSRSIAVNLTSPITTGVALSTGNHTQDRTEAPFSFKLIRQLSSRLHFDGELSNTPRVTSGKTPPISILKQTVYSPSLFISRSPTTSRCFGSMQNAKLQDLTVATNKAPATAHCNTEADKEGQLLA